MATNVFSRAKQARPSNRDRPAASSNAELAHTKITFSFALIFTVLAIMIFSGIERRLLMSTGVRDSQTFGYFIVMSSYALLVCAALVSTFSAKLLFRSLLLWLPAIALFGLSVLWTADVQGTILKLISFSLLVVSVSLFCSSKAYYELFKGILLLGLITGLGSLIGFLLFSDSVYFFAHRMFVGVFVHKGPLADAAVISALVAAYCLTTKRTVLLFLIFSTCVWAIYMSATWSAIFGFTAALFVIMRPSLGGYILLACHALAISLPIILGAYDTAWIAEALGRDVTFSGRAHLWNFVILQMDDIWLLGSGFHNVASTPGWAERLSSLLARDPSALANHTHNFWVETLYMGGLVSILMMIFYMVWIPLKYYDHTKRQHQVLMALTVYLAFTASLKVPFYSNSLPSFIYLLAITVFATQNSLPTKK